MAWKPYNPKVSPSTLSLFRECPRCFYLKQRVGISRPESGSFALHNAVDALMKREFDIYRAAGEPHPIMRDLPGDLVPLAHPRLEAWRTSSKGDKGLNVLHSPSGLQATGKLDDVWVSRESGSLHVVDYKTHGGAGAFDLRKGWGPNYRRQVEFYAYILERLADVDAPVSSTAFFVVETPDKGADSFDGALRFTGEIVSHECDLSWVEEELTAVQACLEAETAPLPSERCTYCTYIAASSQH